MISFNATCDVWYTAVFGFNPPDIANVDCYLVDNYRESSNLALGRQYSAVMEVALDSGMQDGYDGLGEVTIQIDTGEVYLAIFVERDRKKWGDNFLRVYLMSQQGV